MPGRFLATLQHDNANNRCQRCAAQWVYQSTNPRNVRQQNRESIESPGKTAVSGITFQEIQASLTLEASARTTAVRGLPPREADARFGVRELENLNCE